MRISVQRCMRLTTGSILSCRAGEDPMMNRRGFMLTLTTGLVALGFVVGTVIADELLGTITKVDVDGKVLTVVEKETDKEIKIKVTDETETVYKGATKKLDLEKLEKKVDAAIDKGAKG